MTTIKETMQALVLEAFSSPFVFKTLDRPIPKQGEVLVKIMASGVNPLDTKIWNGKAGHAQQPLPAILGLDIAGTVVSVGAGVSSFKPGDEVYGLTGGVAGLQGSLAEYAAVDARLLAVKPANLTMREAAAVPLVFITAWEGLVDRAHVHEGQKVLVHAGAGGVGHMAVQLAKAFHAEVFATVSPSKMEIVKLFGATPIDYTTATLTEYVEKYTAGTGFDIVYDTLGGATLDASFVAVRNYEGHVLSALGYGTHNLAPLAFRGATYSGVFTLLPMLTGQYREHHGEILREATKLIEAGLVKPLLDERKFTLNNVLDAYAAIEQQKTMGKLVVDVQ